MNDHEAQRIAASVHALRPDWPTSSLLTLIRKNLIDRPRRDVAVALTWVACETTTHTPARVLEQGPWWRAAAVDGAQTGVTRKYDESDTCSVCSYSEAVCQRYWPDDHPFVSVAEARANRAQIDVRRTVAALKDELAPTAPPPEPRGLDALTERRPELAEAAERIAAACPGLRNEREVEA